MNRHPNAPSYLPKPNVTAERMAGKSLVKVDVKGEMIAASGVDALLSDIRPEWRSKSLIKRVKALLPVDPSSACQRLLNAAIFDLRKKIVIAGIDLAAEAARTNKLPPVDNADDVLEKYSTWNTLGLAYRMGIISRPEWRRLQRAYDIRRDLEHEDDEYEASIEDCLYVFKSCIDIVLAHEPIEIVKVNDVKEIVETSKAVALSPEFTEDYEKAPDVRQLEIYKYLVGIACNSKKSDVVQVNAVETLRELKGVTSDTVKIQIAEQMQAKLGRQPLDTRTMKVAAAAEVVLYLKQAKVKGFFQEIFKEFKKVGPRWTQNARHADLLDNLEDFGGLGVCPAIVRQNFVLWMAQCYLGEPGGYGHFGRNRRVFYSNVGAPRIYNIFKILGSDLADDLENAVKNKVVQAAIKDKYLSRRLDDLRDLVETGGN